MKTNLKSFSSLIIQSTWAYTRPIFSFDDLHDWLSLVFGIILANIVGIGLTTISPLAFILVNVGSLLGTINCILPRHGRPEKSTLVGIFLIALGASIGIYLQSFSILIILLFSISLYCSGIVRNFSIGMYVRCLLGSISLLAGAQLRGELPAFDVLKGLGALILGMSIVALTYCIFTSENDQSKIIVSNLYEQLYLIAQEKPSNYIHTRIQAREYIETMPKIYHKKTPWIYELIAQADLIASSIYWQKNSENRIALQQIIATLRGMSSNTLFDSALVSPEIKKALNIVQNKRATESSLLHYLLPNKEGIAEFREIFLSYKGSSSRFALRLMLTGVICHLSSILLNSIYPLPLANHEFWVVLSGCLMVMPGYHGTLGKIMSRTLGSILGAFTGIFLHQLLASLFGLNLLFFMIIASALVILYETVRKLSQAFVMFSVTTWLTFTLGGNTAGFTRLTDVIVGALLAFVIFFIFPTWHIQVLRRNLNTWSINLNSILSNLSNKKLIQKPLTDMWLITYRIQGRVNRSIQEIILESPKYNDTSVDTLIKDKKNTDELINIQHNMENIILKIMQIEYYLIRNSPSNSNSIDSKLNSYQKKINRLSYVKSNNAQSSLLLIQTTIAELNNSISDLLLNIKK
ncbi:FUSC family protein [Enterococcus faecium]|uniref:Integral membrane bound transporter domain-containing protein n=1 Tax=Enterococcus faecium TaxID=1352 RepID=A0A3F3NRN9_ENTFC|nr:FUSC family protein [Enterococcus faecium]ELZ1274178.1 FUSC family protein [Enterococcus faecium]EME8099236.1 FUSC family protein [Enterococcus faecium]NTK75018.1 FUSC family protein [Enterococcus faecium]PQG42641.1 FUSC family protein [Enterococcus faecium]RBS35175.1 hypothetical protein EB12_00603 [Enterococcus faecium]